MRYAALPFALWIAVHTLPGVAGMSMRSMPSGDSASITALITTGGAPIVPDSPMPFTPIGLVRQRHFFQRDLEVRHHVGARHHVVHERCR